MLNPELMERVKKLSARLENSGRVREEPSPTATAGVAGRLRNTAGSHSEDDQLDRCQLVQGFINLYEAMLGTSEPDEFEYQRALQLSVLAVGGAGAGGSSCHHTAIPIWLDFPANVRAVATRGRRSYPVPGRPPFSRTGEPTEGNPFRIIPLVTG